MNQMSAQRGSASQRRQRITGIVFAVFQAGQAAFAAQLPVTLGAAGNYAILAKSGISTVPASMIVGDIGVSPIDSTAITGFALSLPAGGSFSTSPEVTGKVYAPDYAAPTSTILTTAVGDMETAYADAAGRSLPDFTEFGAGQIGGRTLVPGLYKWSSGVLISSDVTLAGGPSDVWIFQISGKIIEANGAKVLLAGGASAANIFWQSFGDVALGTAAHFEGIILAQTSISLGTGASLNGRILAQTAVTLDASKVIAPTPGTTLTLVSAAAAAGPYVDAIGQVLDLGNRTITVPLSGNVQFYRVRSATALTIAGISITGLNVVIHFQ